MVLLFRCKRFGRVDIHVLRYYSLGRIPDGAAGYHGVPVLCLGAGGSRLSGKRCHADVFPLFGWRKSRVRCILVDGEGRVG